jgi:hypothetical protein
MSRPKVFIGCSREGSKIADVLHKQLLECSDPVIWKDGVFGLSGGTLSALVEATQKFDFAVLILTRDDVALVRDSTRNLPRDNVLFELGLFMGALGRNRTFIVHSETNPPDLPSDLAGVTSARFVERPDYALQAAIRAATTDISGAIEELCVRPPTTLKDQPTAEAWDSLACSVRAGLSTGHLAFSEEIRANVQHWDSQSLIWRARRIHSTSNYSSCLLSVYRHAKTEIFSTSVPRYMPAWTTQWGHEVLHAQRNNRLAVSTRVFIFESRDDLQRDGALDILRKHERNHVHVWLYFAGSAVDSIFPEELGPDWTIVDNGVVIGITREYGSEFEADWHFDNEKEAARFCQHRDTLLSRSERFRG